MTKMQSKLVEDWKSALKARDEKKNVLSMIITELKNRAIKENISGADQRVVSDDVAMEVLQKMAKQRKEAIESYQNAQRPDLAERESMELAVIESYLPKALSDDELNEIIEKIVKDLGASSMADIGKVMGAAIKETAGRADGKRIQKVVQSMLASK